MLAHVCVARSQSLRCVNGHRTARNSLEVLYRRCIFAYQSKSSVYSSFETLDIFDKFCNSNYSGNRWDTSNFGCYCINYVNNFCSAPHEERKKVRIYEVLRDLLKRCLQFILRCLYALQIGVVELLRSKTKGVCCLGRIFGSGSIMRH